MLRKMNRILILLGTLLLAGAVAVSLASCDKGNDPAEETTGAEETTAADETTVADRGAYG